MKKPFFMLCAFCFTIVQCLTVIGVGGNVGEIIGYVTDIYGDIVHIVGEPPDNDEILQAQIQIGNAPVYDLRTGFRVPASEITTDMDIRVVFGSSEEPLSAKVVWLNWDDEDAAVFTVVASDNINFSADGAVFLSADGKYRVALTPETEILHPIHGWISPTQITPGTEFFVWVDMITASTPALVFPDKVVVVQ